MSVFTSLITKSLELPSDPGQSVTIRKLAPKHLAAAMKAQQMRSLADLREMGGPAFLKELDSLREKHPDEAQQAGDPILRYDATSVLQSGVIGWSYEQPRTADTFEDLDDETREFLVREILRLSKPSLFAEYDAEQARKNGSSSSSVH